ncbi:MAG: hypothetical protein JWN70_5538 [Planctomycetaceae bacterium]|nr:hypothetical protein [Planctomycetaceae bacterium]
MNLSSMTLAGASALGLMLMTLTGCGGGVDPKAPKAAITGGVHGKVTHAGQPVTEGQVIFTNLTLKTDVVGDLAAEGAYSATNLPEGNYSVRVAPKPVVPAMVANAPPVTPADPANIPKKYRVAQTSGLTTAIKKGDNTFDIKVD